DSARWCWRGPASSPHRRGWACARVDARGASCPVRPPPRPHVRTMLGIPARIPAMRILVTGAAGFIGSHFIRIVLERHPDVEVVNFDAMTYAASEFNNA